MATPMREDSLELNSPPSSPLKRRRVEEVSEDLGAAGHPNGGAAPTTGPPPAALDSGHDRPSNGDVAAANGNGTHAPQSPQLPQPQQPASPAAAVANRTNGGPAPMAASAATTTATPPPNGTAATAAAMVTLITAPPAEPEPAALRVSSPVAAQQVAPSTPPPPVEPPAASGSPSTPPTAPTPPRAASPSMPPPTAGPPVAAAAEVADEPMEGIVEAPVQPAAPSTPPPPPAQDDPATGAATPPPAAPQSPALAPAAAAEPQAAAADRPSPVAAPSPAAATTTTTDSASAATTAATAGPDQSIQDKLEELFSAPQSRGHRASKKRVSPLDAHGWAGTMFDVKVGGESRLLDMSERLLVAAPADLALYARNNGLEVPGEDEEDDAAAGAAADASGAAPPPRRRAPRPRGRPRGRPRNRGRRARSKPGLAGASSSGDASGPHAAPKTAIVTTRPELRLKAQRFDAQAHEAEEYITPGDQNPGAQAVRSVEYDMDQEDTAWLALINTRRAQAELPEVSRTAFETIIDRLEKESFFRESKSEEEGQAAAEPSFDENAVCDICRSGECENSNAILFCDACNLPVHQECYGVPYVPEGQWLCRKCFQSPSAPVACELCPIAGGAFKQTSDQRWVHVVCASFIPETCFANDVYLEPVEGLDNVPAARWKLDCYICGDNHGACIQCSRPSCCTAFHATCAQKARLYTVTYERQDGSTFKRVMCDAHTPKDVLDEPPLIQRDKNGDLCFRNAKARELFINGSQSSNVASVSLPCIDHERVEAIVSGLGVGEGSTFAESIHQYWLLKRRSRRGVPLLRRLQASHPHQDAQIEAERRQFHHFRQELEKARMLSGQVIRRERMKREVVDLKRRAVSLQADPLQSVLSDCLDVLVAKDKENVFTEPVTGNLLPNYYQMVKVPMDLSVMKLHVDAGDYATVAEFIEDFQTMCRNSMLYNPEDSWWHSYSRKYYDGCNVLLEDLVKRATMTGIDPKSGRLLSEIPDLAPEALARASIDIVYRLEGCDEQEEAIAQKIVAAQGYRHLAGRTSATVRHAQELEEHRLQATETRWPEVKKRKRPKRGIPVLPLESRSEYEGFDFVWAKAPGYPWYPAIVIDPKIRSSEAPDPWHVPKKDVLARRPKPKAQDSNRHLLVMFYDYQRTWLWLPANKLRVLFGNSRSDDATIADISKPALKKQVQDAYQAALLVRNWFDAAEPVED